MDKKSFKKEPYHVKKKHNGEIDKTVLSSNTDVGTPSLPAELHVYGTARFDDPALAANALIFGHRLSVSGSSSVPAASVPSASVLYLTSHTSEFVGLYLGDHWGVKQVNMVTKSLQSVTASNTNHDVFVYWDQNRKVIDMEFLAWSSDQARAQELRTQDGVLVKSGDPTRRYAGTIRTVAAGVISDSTTRRYLWNYYNRVSRQFVAINTTTAWNYSSATWRFSGSGTTSIGTNAVGVVCGAIADVNANVNGIASTVTNASHMEYGVGLNDTTNLARGGGFCDVNQFSNISCRWDGQITIPGFHLICWLEHGENATGTFYGANSVRACGLQGVIWG
jgi:hypothetical protein